MLTIIKIYQENEGNIKINKSPYIIKNYGMSENDNKFQRFVEVL